MWPRHDDERFWAKVQGGSVEECWLWTGAKSRDYGQYAGVPAHRVAYEMLRAEVPDGLVMDHVCCNPPCVNPWHLEPVTYSTNTTRSVDRGATNTPIMNPANAPRYHYNPAYVRVAIWAKRLKSDGLIDEITIELLLAEGHLNRQKAEAAMSWLAHWGEVDARWKREDGPRVPRGVLQPVPERIPRGRASAGLRGGATWVAEKS